MGGRFRRSLIGGIRRDRAQSKTIASYLLLMSKQFRPWNPDQMILFPQAMRDALDEGHIVFRIMDVVQTLDIACVIDRMEE